MIKVKDGYAKLINTSYTGDISLVLLSNGGTIGYDVSTNTILATIGSNVASADKLKNKVKLWGLDFDGTNNISDSIVMDNSTFISMKDTGGADRVILNFDGLHRLFVGNGTSSAGYNTYIDGNNIYLRYGTSHTTGLTLDSNGIVSLAKDLLFSNNMGIGTYYTDGNLSYNFLVGSDNILRVGGGNATRGYNTYLLGNSVHLRYGTSHALGMILNSSGNVTIGSSDLASTNCKLYVDGDIITTGITTATNFISGNGVNDFSAGTVKLSTLNIPTSNGGTTYGPGSNGLVLKSNGTTVYWANDNNSNTWRAVQVNGTQIAGTGTSTYALNFISGTGITVAGTSGSSSAANSITITNAGVRSTTINGNYLRVNTNGTNADLTIPYATNASKLNNLGNHTEAASSATAPSSKFPGVLHTQGLYMTCTYNDTNTPSTFGNIINVLGTGGSLLLLGWNGTYKTGNLYYRSHRDVTTSGGWTDWEQIAYISNIPTKVSLLTNDSGFVTGGPYLPLAGGTMTGVLSMKNDINPRISFIPSSGSSTLGTIYLMGGSSTAYSGIKYKFRQWSYTANSLTRLSYYEDYNLPETPAGLTANTSYTILTTKNASVSGGGSTWGSSITVNINGESKTLTIPANPNTHWTTRLYAGASGTAANSVVDDPYLKVTDDNVYRNQIRFVGSGNTTVKSDAEGNIIISSTGSALANCYWANLPVSSAPDVNTSPTFLHPHVIGKLTLQLGEDSPYRTSINMENNYLYILPRLENSGYNYNTVINPKGGNVGIGTPYPAAKLHVAGSVYVLNRLNFKRDYDSEYLYSIGTVYGGNTDQQCTFLLSNTSGSGGILFETHGTSGNNYPIYIKQNAVTIGAWSDPTATLDVRGNTVINGTSYDLLSLIRNTTNVEAGIGIAFANTNGTVAYLHALPKDGYFYRDTPTDNYMILDTGNYISHTVESRAWTAVTTKNAWSRIMTIGANSNVILTICFSQNSQASAHGYFISTGWNCAKIMLVMMGGFTGNSTPQVRITSTNSTTFHVEVYNTYGYNGATSISFGCRAILAYGSMSTINTYTAGGGTVCSSLTSNSDVAMNFNADMVDGLHGSNLVRGGNIEYSPNMTSWLPGYPSFVGSAYNKNSSSWWNLISVRHRNGGNDGNKYGMYICTSLNTSDNNLVWNKQNNGNWIGERTILDSSNYTSYCAPASHSHAYYPLAGGVNMSVDNTWIGSTMGGGTDYWRIGGTGTGDNGVCQITIGDNSNDYFQIVIADYSGTNYTALLVKYGGTYAPHFYENSDQRLKENIQAILNKDNIPQIKEFDWKESGEHSYGLIAQELEEQGYPELVSTKDDGYKTVNYSAALSLIVGKLQVKILELEKEIEILKSK